MSPSTTAARRCSSRFAHCIDPHGVRADGPWTRLSFTPWLILRLTESAGERARRLTQLFGSGTVRSPAAYSADQDRDLSQFPVGAQPQTAVILVHMRSQRRQRSPRRHPVHAGALSPCLVSNQGLQRSGPNVSWRTRIRCANSMHDRVTATVLRFGIKHGPTWALDRPVAPLNDVVKVLAAVHQRVHPMPIFPTMPAQCPMTLVCVGKSASGGQGSQWRHSAARTHAGMRR